MILLILLLSQQVFTQGEELSFVKLKGSDTGETLGLPSQTHFNSLEPASQIKNERNTQGGRTKRDPFGINARGFHDDVFALDFGNFKPYKREDSTIRSKREVSQEGSSPKGEIEVVAKRRNHKSHDSRAIEQDTMSKESGLIKVLGKRYFSPYRTRSAAGFPKRRPTNDFYGDAFTQGFGDFSTMRKRRPSADFHGDTFTEGFGDFDTMKKRRPNSDFHGDVFTQGFGDFATMRKRKPGSVFSDNIFTQGFGDFDTMKKRRPSDDFHGDAFTEGFGDFSTMRKRRPSDDFHGDAFTEGFGDFSTMRKREIPRNDDQLKPARQ